MSDRDDAELQALARATTTADRERLEVPAGLWDRIAAEVADGTGIDSASPADPLTTPQRGSGRAVIRPLRRRIIATAGVVGVAASAALAFWGVSRHADDSTVVATAPLSNAGLAPFSVEPSGSARLLEDNGHEFLEVEVAHTPSAPDAYLELWLIDTAVRGMVSLGPFHGDGRYPVPDGVDPARFPIVDVSLEPTDGVPAHSGVSVVRGVLPSDRTH